MSLNWVRAISGTRMTLTLGFGRGKHENVLNFLQFFCAEKSWPLCDITTMKAWVNSITATALTGVGIGVLAFVLYKYSYWRSGGGNSSENSTRGKKKSDNRSNQSETQQNGHHQTPTTSGDGAGQQGRDDGRQTGKDN